MNLNRNFRVLNDIEHCLLRPGMYIGAVSKTKREQWIFDRTENKIKFQEVEVVPALLKCASELVDNSIDVAIDTNFNAATKIKVNVDDKSIEVIDDGIGIPCIPPKGINSKDPEQTCACIAWTTLKSGTSFSDNRKKIGTNGVGSACVNVFSKLFIGESDDGKLRQKIECTNNLSTIKAEKVKKSLGKSGVRVYCEPDLKRFGIDKIDELHKNLIFQRLVSLSICYPKIHFFFNGDKINIKDKDFATIFSDNTVLMSSNNTTIVVFPNKYDEFKQFSCVNGVETIRGGIHVDYITYELSSRIRNKLVKKFKNIRLGDIKNKLGIAILLTDFNNPQFDSQTKESLSNTSTEVSKHIDGKIDFDVFTKKILKTEAIINPIVETFKIKEELKARQELKKVKKIKVKSDKYMAPIGEQKYCIICEGLSARGGLSAALGRNGYGFFAARGVPLNAYDATVQAISANQELKDLAAILELDLFGKEQNKTISFDKIILANDSDIDGIFIANQYVGWFTRFAPNLFNERKIARLITPLVILRDNKDKPVKYFYSLSEFKEFESKNNLDRYKVDYKKGLGSWPKDEFIQLFDTYGFEYFIQDLLMDETGKIYVDHWLNSTNADKRKEYLREYTVNIETM